MGDGVNVAEREKCKRRDEVGVKMSVTGKKV